MFYLKPLFLCQKKIKKDESWRKVWPPHPPFTPHPIPKKISFPRGGRENFEKMGIFLQK